MPEVTHTPTGQYPKPSEVHRLDLTAAADALRARLPGSRRQTESLAREDGVSVVMMAMEAGDTIRDHAAEGVSTVHLLDGHVTVTYSDQDADLRAGEMLVFQPGVRHHLQAEEQSIVLLTITGAETVTVKQ
jgi:quercetin dioxygenase-like cupin family protein